MYGGVSSSIFKKIDFLAEKEKNYNDTSKFSYL